MSLKQFKGVSRLSRGGIFAALTAGLLGACSSDFSRFTDGITKSSVPTPSGARNQPVGVYPPPPAKNSYGKVESSTLAPPVNPAAPVARDSLYAADRPAAAEMPPAAAKRLPAEALPANPASKEKNKTEAAGSAADIAHKSVYIVQGGDTLIGIGRRHKMSVAAIKRDNNLSGDKILVGQKLFIGGAGAAVADSGKARVSIVPTPLPEPVEQPQDMGSRQEKEAAAEISPVKPANETAKPQEPQDKTDKSAATAALTAGAAITAKETAGKDSQTNKDSFSAEKGDGSAAAANNDKVEGAALMIWPVKGNTVSSYGQRTGTSTNDGIDIAVPEGTKVQAAAAGIVIYAGDGLKEFGNTILIRHDDNIVSVYGHNSKLLVARGQQVERGETIALSGSSGNAAFAKLHFEVRKNSAPVNPIKYLPSTR